MRFRLIGNSVASYEACRELRLILPHLISAGHNLVDGVDADVVLSYGHPDEQPGKATVVRWDRTCDNDTMSYTGLTSIIFNSRHERDTWSHWLPSQVNAYVCHGVVDIESISSEAPPGLSSIRHQFDELYVAISQKWEVDTEPIEAVSVSRRIGAQSKKQVGLVVVGEVNEAVARALSGVDIFRIDWLEEPDRAALLSLSSGLLCPHRSPEVPSCVLESLVQGTPILHWGQSSIVEVVGQMGRAWDSTRVIQKYPWDLSGVSATSASQIFLRALQG